MSTVQMMAKSYLRMLVDEIIQICAILESASVHEEAIEALAYAMSDEFAKYMVYLTRIYQSHLRVCK